jgi:hypothetical protein
MDSARNSTFLPLKLNQVGLGRPKTALEAEKARMITESHGMTESRSGVPQRFPRDILDGDRT